MPTRSCIDPARLSARNLGTPMRRLRGAAIVIALLASLAFSGSAMAGTPISWLTVNQANGWGAGTVTSTPSGIQCGSTCRVYFNAGTSVTLTAVASAGSAFARWSWRVQRHLPDLHRRPERGHVGHRYVRSRVSGAARRGHRGQRHILGSVYYLRCGNNSYYSCWAYLAEGSDITLQAVPADHWVFTGWSGACSGSADTCVVSMSEARSVTAIFTPLYRARVLTDGSGLGSVTSSPGGIDCGGGGACEAEFVERHRAHADRGGQARLDIHWLGERGRRHLQRHVADLHHHHGLTRTGRWRTSNG